MTPKDACKDAPLTHSPNWLHQLLPKLRAFFMLKFFAVWLLGALFFTGYFLTLKFPQFAVTTMPVTALDHWIKFSPSALALYVSLWFYVPLAPGLLDDKRELFDYYRAMIVLSLVGLLIFFFWPTASPRPDIDWSQFPSYGPLKKVDGSGNALPSLHAAFAVYTAMWMHRYLRRVAAPFAVQALNGLWCVGILYSTLATKQHVAVDIYAGSMLGWLAALLHVRWLRGRYAE